MSFEEVSDTVTHHLHQPQIESLSELGEDVADNDLAVRIEFEIDNRTAVVEATVAQDLVPDGYLETYFYKNGTRQHRALPPNQRRSPHFCCLAYLPALLLVELTLHSNKYFALSQ